MFLCCRCMAEGAGDVSFIKPQTVLDNTDNKNQDSWALNLASTDFELLCPDGTRKAVTDAATCNLAQVSFLFLCVILLLHLLPGKWSRPTGDRKDLQGNPETLEFLEHFKEHFRVGSGNFFFFQAGPGRGIFFGMWDIFPGIWVIN